MFWDFFTISRGVLSTACATSSSGVSDRTFRLPEKENKHILLLPPIATFLNLDPLAPGLGPWSPAPNPGLRPGPPAPRGPGGPPAVVLGARPLPRGSRTAPDGEPTGAEMRVTIGPRRGFGLRGVLFLIRKVISGERSPGAVPAPVWATRRATCVATSMVGRVPPGGREYK